MRTVTRRGMLALPFAATLAAADEPPSVKLKNGLLRVSGDGRYLQHKNGTPFFYLGDTAWELFHRLTREETELYLENRRARQFTVIQAVALAEFDGLTEPNRYGDLPLISQDPARPNDKYFQHVDWVLKTAERKGLLIGLLPTWGDKVRKDWGTGPVVFNEQNAYTYGRFLGERYRKAANLIWILGGDRRADGQETLWREMARGLREADKGQSLITYHPMGGTSSTQFFAAEPWIDFHMLQSSHGKRDGPNHQMVARDYARTPAKPVLDGEPRYEDHPIAMKPENGWFDDYDVRQAAYWAVFSGACGHTYGCHDIWQFLSPERKPITFARTNWQEALDLPGAGQMAIVRALIESRPVPGRVPDAELIVEGQGEGADHVAAMRGNGFAMVYLPTGRPVRVAVTRIGAQNYAAWWVDPRTGDIRSVGTFSAEGAPRFTPPGRPARGNDWVLVLDSTARNFGPPGRR